MQEGVESPSTSAVLAEPAERLCAFLIDLFLIGAAGVFTRSPLATAVLFFAYHALMIHRFGWTLGKWIVGIHVVDQEGRPPGIAAAWIRSLAYGTTSLSMGLGSFWLLLHPQYKAWQDLFADSLVVRARRSRVWARLGVSLFVGVWTFLAVGAWSYNETFLPRQREDRSRLAQARAALDTLAILQERHKKIHGRCTTNIRELVLTAQDPQGFFRSLSKSVDVRTLRFLRHPYGYALEARAFDSRGTAVRAVESMETDE